MTMSLATDEANVHGRIFCYEQTDVPAILEYATAGDR